MPINEPALGKRKSQIQEYVSYKSSLSMLLTLNILLELHVFLRP